MITRQTIIFLMVFSLFGYNCSSDKLNNSQTVSENIPNIGFIYVKSYPHDTTSFTEGFLIHDGELYESTGATEGLQQTKSLFGIVDLATGKIDIKVELDRSKYFGEGITFLNGKVFQLTYKSKIGFVYDAETFEMIKEFTLPGEEGWGLTTDGVNLIMSDGTHELTYLDSATLQVVKKISVTENRYAKDYLNELEYIKGYFFANIWKTNTIVKIDPANGKVIGKLDLTSLFEESKNIYSGSLEMNGIAYDSVANSIFVTGKLWPRIYELKINK